jgi:hypothetical protein
MKRTTIFCSLLLSVVAGAWMSVSAAEVSVRREALPAAVSAALESRYHGAEVLALTRERTKGVMLYEAEMKVSGRRVDALFESNGTLREEEAEIAASELPEGVRAAYARSAQAGWKIERAERITSGASAKPPRFELLAVGGKRRVELVYAADGRRLSAARAGEKD